MIVPEATEMVTLNRLHKRNGMQEPEVKGKDKERALKARFSVSEVQRSGGESSNSKANARVTVTELEKGKSGRSPTIGRGTLGRQAQWGTEDEKKAERRRLRMLSDGHPERCECQLCQGAASVQKSLWDKMDEK